MSDAARPGAAPARPRTSLWRRLALVLAGVLAATTLVIATAPLWLTGPRFARLIEGRLPHTRGHIHLGGGSWSWGTAWALARGQPAPLAFQDVSVTDPDGTVVLRARRLSGAIERTRAAVIVHDLRVEDGAWRMARTADHLGIGFLRALETAPSGASAAPSTGGAAGRAFRLQDVALDGLDVDFDLPGWALSLRQAHGHGQLAVEPRSGGPPLFTFAVTDVAVPGGGQLAVLDGIWRATLPFSSARITRIAVAENAPDTLALDASQIVTGRSTTAVRGAFSGIFVAPGAPRPPGITLAVTLANAADALQAAATMRGWTPRLTVGGAHATLAMSFSGPLAAAHLDVRARDFDVRYGDVAARAFGFHLDAQPAARQALLQELTLTSPAGGRLTVDAHLDHWRAGGTLALEHFDTTPYLPAGLRKLASGILHGRVQGHVDLAARTAALDDVAMTIARPPGAVGPTAVHVVTATEPVPPRTPGDFVLRLGTARLDHGTLDLPRVTATIAGGRVTAQGALTLWDPTNHDWMPSPSFDLTLDVSRIALEQLLGTALATGAVSLRARARGTFDAVTLQARVAPRQRVRVLGDAFTLPPALALAFGDGMVTLAPLTLSGDSGATLAARGTIATGGQLALQANATGVSLRPLIAWAAGLPAGDVPIDGRVGVELALSGDAATPALKGTLAISEARFQGRPLGGGTLALATGSRGELHAHGGPLDGITLDGVVQPGPRGARITATATLSHLRLDPFLAPVAAKLPVAATLNAEVSGVITAALAPGHGPTVDARLSALAVAVRPAPARVANKIDGGALTLEAVGSINAGIQSGGAWHVTPARFAGSLGRFELSASGRGHALEGRVSGRVNATGFMPFVRGTVEALDGELPIDVHISTAAGRPVAAEGALTLAPLRARFAGFPMDVRATAGRLVLTSNDATVAGLTLKVGAASLAAAGRVTRGPDGSPRLTLELRGDLDARLVEPLAQGYLRDAGGQARLTAHLEGPLLQPALRAHLDVSGVGFTLMPGANQLRFASGGLDLAGSAVTLRNLDLRIGDGNRIVVGADARDPGILRVPRADLAAIAIDLPVQGRVRTLATPVAIIDEAAFGVRLTGTPARSLRLAGDIFIDAARVPAALRHPKPPTAGASASKARAVLNATHLDLRIRSRPRAVTVEVAHVPDLHGALDYRLTGTVGAPEVKGSVKPAGAYSTIAFFLARLLGKGP